MARRVSQMAAWFEQLNQALGLGNLNHPSHTFGTVGTLHLVARGKSHPRFQASFFESCCLGLVVKQQQQPCWTWASQRTCTQRDIWLFSNAHYVPVKLSVCPWWHSAGMFLPEKPMAARGCSWGGHWFSWVVQEPQTEGARGRPQVLL